MKLKIENLGRIRHAEIDIRPLTVFIGPNNTNKTWTAYTLYGLLQPLSRVFPGPYNKPRIETVMKGVDGSFTERLGGMLEPLFDGLAAEPAPTRVEYSLSLQPLFEGASIRQVSFFSIEAICRLLGLPPERLSGASASLEFFLSEFVTSNVSMDITLERPLNRLLMKISRRRDLEDDRAEPIILSTHSNVPWTRDLIVQRISTELWQTIDNVVVLPAERNGLLPVWPLPSEVKLDVPTPVVDFGWFLGLGQAVAELEQASTSQSQARLLALLKKVMGGEVVYEGGAEHRRLVFRTAGAEFPLNAAASLSKAVAGLAIYLERLFQPDDVLIIDELEMNAHPQAQVALIELIAALVNAGVRVVFTTHSPYVVDHLNNLMEASQVPAERQKALSEKFALGSPSCFISPERVAAHVFEDSPGGEVHVRDVLDRQKNLIKWSTFSEVSAWTKNIYIDVLRAAEEDEV